MQGKRKSSKYKVPPRGLQRVRRNGAGRPIHASKLEDKVIKDLKDRGIEYEYEPETFPYERKVRGAHCGNCGSKDVVVRRRYTPDLRIGDFFVEIKGKFTAENRSKMEDFRRGHPEIDLRFLFQRDNWITKKHKSKYSDWCKKLDLKYHIGTEVPQKWIHN